ncbi:unnamed protein product [Hymenolepis diminuta]|uniref:Uncharacterized protein n=1 Tax=Hymenolepis diminuta TaxID=6216 RepID=A0A564Y4E4_HYMDI|nr:unnamed protein product [Hymenolepis diminuta]
MADTTITNELKRHAVLVSTKAKHGNLKIAELLTMATSFVCNKELNENTGDELATCKRRERYQCSVDSVTTPRFVRRVIRNVLH